MASKRGISSIGLIGIGLLMLFVGYRLYVRNGNLAASGVQTFGIVEGSEEGKRWDRDSERFEPVYRPTIAFRATDDATHTIAGEWSDYRYYPGAETLLVYDAKNPDFAVQGKLRDLLLLPAVIMTFGVFAVVIGLLMTLFIHNTYGRRKPAAASGSGLPLPPEVVAKRLREAARQGEANVWKSLIVVFIIAGITIAILLLILLFM